MIAERVRHLAHVVAASAVAVALLPQAAAAQGAEQFFKGKTINLYIGFGPGGTYDYYGRLVARFLGRHLPGDPTVVAQSMPGSGGLRVANYLFSAAPKDGTAVAVITQTAAIEDALRSPGVQYKAAEFNWIGRMTAILEVHFTWKTSKGRTIEDARSHEIPVAGTGAGSPSEGYPKLLNAFAGTKFKIISGYPSSTEGMIAMERGEVDGALTSWNTIKRTRPQWIKNRDINVLVQYGAERHPEMNDIPTILETARTPEGRAVMEFYIGGAQLGRSLAAPPGLPADRVTILRRAFDAMLKDRDFLAEIEKTGQEFYPASGEQVQKLIAATANAPRPIVELTESTLRAK
jgi:tripartite-type tricarboxylate transporter receptor subunit TctC